MEEILASIRKIIESGDERSGASLALPQGSADREADPANAAGEAPVPLATVTTLRPPPAENAASEVKHSGEPEPSSESLDEAAAFFDVDFFDLRTELEQEFAGSAIRPASSVAGAAVGEATGHPSRLPAVAARLEAPVWEAAWSPRSDGRHAALRAAATVAVDRQNADGVRRAGSADPAGAAREELLRAVAEERESQSTVGPERVASQADTPGIFVPANNDEPRMSEFRSAVLDDAAHGSLPPASSALLSERTGGLVGASFDELSRAIRDGELRSMEEMAEELMRPMLQEWLDENLPKLVERLVREEIERVARGGR